MRVEHRDFVDLAPQEFLHAKLRDRLRFNELVSLSTKSAIIRALFAR